MDTVFSRVSLKYLWSQEMLLSRRARGARYFMLSGLSSLTKEEDTVQERDGKKRVQRERRLSERRRQKILQGVQEFQGGEGEPQMCTPYVPRTYVLPVHPTDGALKDTTLSVESGSIDTRLATRSRSGE
jgi:hypothetical protein